MKKIILAVIATILLVGCGGIGEDIEKSTKKMEKSISKISNDIKKSEVSFLASKDTKDLKIYVDREDLLKYFKDAKTELSKAKTSFKSLKKVVDDDDKKNRNIALAKIKVLNLIIRNSKKLSKKPNERVVELKKSFENAKKVNNSGIDNQKNIVSLSNEIVSFLNKELKTNKNIEIKKSDIEKDIEKSKNIVIHSKETLKTLNTEYSKDKNMDIAIFSNSSKKLIEKKKETIDLQKLTNSKIDQINTSYTKILSDMREDLYIVVGSTSWDNYYDSPTEHTTILPKIKVKRAFYERLSNNAGVLATYSKGSVFGGLSIKISPQADWKILRIDPKRGLARGDDAAEFWINDAPVEYFHKYVLVKNGVKTESGWVKVDEKTYEKHYNDLGMSILTKPYGYYESDVIKTATPAGMAFVGNKRYGEWKNDQSGNSFWHYYGMYSFFTGGNRGYYRSDYNNYNTYRRTSPRRGYYGSNNSYGTFGTRSFSRSSPSSMRTRMKSTGFKKSSRSIRSAGRSSRGRGPGGGGK